MNFTAERQAIVARLFANWTTTPVRLENQPANPAADLSNGYVALWIRDGEGYQATLGSTPGLRFPGVILIQVFTPHNALDGDITARNYASSLSDIFRLQQFQTTYSGKPSGVITCHVPSIGNAAQEHDWWMVNVSCPFWRQLAHA